MIKSLTPHAAAQTSFELTGKEVTISRIDLSVLSSFKEWTGDLTSRIESASKIWNIDKEASVYLLDMVYTSGALFYISGMADVLIYLWSNNEPKIIPIWGCKYIIQQDLFWIGKYPFLSEKPNTKGYYTLMNELFSKAIMPSGEENSYVLASHNNHFGHFIIDSLPCLICWDKCNRKLYPRQTVIPFDYKYGICELLKYCDLETNAPSKLPQRNYQLHSLELTEAMPSNIFTNAYLWRQIGPRFKRSLIKRGVEQGLSLNKISKRIFLCRTGDYTSRIANVKQIIRFLERQGFCIIDPSTATSTELAIVLSEAEIIISESGSTTLNAVVFSSQNARIISLCSERLFSSTDPAMLHGGLPYMIAFCDRIEFILGKPVEKHPIQSSDTCVYDAEQLAQMISR